MVLTNISYCVLIFALVAVSLGIPVNETLHDDKIENSEKPAIGEQVPSKTVVNPNPTPKKTVKKAFPVYEHRPSLRSNLDDFLHRRRRGARLKRDSNIDTELLELMLANKLLQQRNQQQQQLDYLLNELFANPEDLETQKNPSDLELLREALAASESEPNSLTYPADDYELNSEDEELPAETVPDSLRYMPIYFDQVPSFKKYRTNAFRRVAGDDGDILSREHKRNGNGLHLFDGNVYRSRGYPKRTYRRRRSSKRSSPRLVALGSLLRDANPRSKRSPGWIRNFM